MFVQDLGDVLHLIGGTAAALLTSFNPGCLPPQCHPPSHPPRPVLASLPPAVFVQDLGDVLHLIGGTAAALLIFFNPGCMLINAAIVKDSSARLARVSTLQRAREDASMRVSVATRHRGVGEMG